VLILQRRLVLWPGQAFLVDRPLYQHSLTTLVILHQLVGRIQEDLMAVISTSFGPVSQGNQHGCGVVTMG
jgi:hypothetical protein